MKSGHSAVDYVLFSGPSLFLQLSYPELIVNRAKFSKSILEKTFKICKKCIPHGNQSIFIGNNK